MPIPTIELGDNDWSDVETYIASLAQFGSGGHYDDYKPVSRWRAVHGGIRVAPYITVTGDLYVGIAPFHGCATGQNSGITRVRYSLNASAFVDDAAWAANPETGEWAWWVKIAGGSLADAVNYQLCAIVEPEEGYARAHYGPIDTSAASAGEEEHSFFFSANPGETLAVREVIIAGTGDDDTGTGLSAAPWRTLGKAVDALNTDGDIDGGVITFRDGTYEWPSQVGNPFIDNDRLLWLRRDPAADPLSAKIATAWTSNFHGMGAARIRMTQIHVTSGNELGQATDTPSYVPPFAWADRCVFDGTVNSFSPGFRPDKYPCGTWYTGCQSTTLDTGPDGMTHVEGHESDTTTEDAMRHILCLMDSYIHDVDNAAEGEHPDTLQYQAPLVGTTFKNVLLMNVKTDRIGASDNAVQGLPFIRHLFAVPKWEGFAMVNCEAHCAGLAQILHSIDHFIRWNCSTLKYDATGGVFTIDDNDSESLTTTLNGQSMKGCIDAAYSFNAAGGGDNLSNHEVWADENTYLDSSPQAPGTNATTGVTEADLFVNPSAGDYRPKLTGPLAARMTALVPFDINNDRRDATTAGGPYASTDETGVTGTLWHTWAAGGQTYFVRQAT